MKIKETTLPGTINFHVNWNCNADCVFCYRPSGAELSDAKRAALIESLAAVPPLNDESRVRRINVAGGEPTLLKTLPRLLEQIKSQGLSTSLITNASVYLNKPSKLNAVLGHLDMLGVSVDSVSEQTNQKIKRPHFSAQRWVDFAGEVKYQGVYLKMNTTVCRFNAHEDISGFVGKMAPNRWKILEAIAVGGTQGTDVHSADDWIATNAEFQAYVDRHLMVEPTPVVEHEALLRGSYAMISPDGCFYDSTQGHYTKSDPILEVGVDEAFRQVSFSHGRFVNRGGDFKIPVVAK